MLIVPKADLNLFSCLRSSRRSVVPTTAFEPWWFISLPPVPKSARKFFFLPAREITLTPCSLPVRGWIIQQIHKISASANVHWDVTVHVDSDICFVRPLRREQLIRGEKVRFYRDENPVGQAPYWRWHLSASRLLGLPPMNYLGAGYVNQLVVWRRSVATALVQRLSEVNRADWRNVLARNRHWSEYTLYGAFADHVPGNHSTGLFATKEELCHNCWDDLKTAEAENRFVEELQPHHVAYLLQSTATVSPERRRRLFNRMLTRAAS
jgi:hypothetical protein